MAISRETTPAAGATAPPNLPPLIFVCLLSFPARSIAGSLDAGAGAERTAVVL